MRSLTVIIVGLALCSCNVDDVGKTWTRLDGQPAPAGQLETDMAACDSEKSKVQVSGASGNLDTIRKACMAKRGWQRLPD
jgi:hypothetical protein